MRKSVLLFISLLVTVFAFKVGAQEITSFDNFWGPVYYQDDQKITSKELKELFKKNEEISQHWKRYETNLTIGGVAVLAELGFAVWAGAEFGKDNGEPLIPVIGTLGTVTIAAIFLTKSNKNKRNAILTYNKQFDKKTAFRLVPTSNQNGVGLALKF